MLKKLGVDLAIVLDVFNNRVVAVAKNDLDVKQHTGPLSGTSRNAKWFSQV